MLNPNYNYLIIDTETTGLSTTEDDIIQLGLIRMDHEWNITDRFSHYVKPEHFSIDQLKPLIQHITGIDTTQIMSAPPLSQVWWLIEQYFDSNTVIIWHNIAFDIAMMSKHHSLNYADTIDTYDVTRTLLHYQRSYSLEIIHQQLLLQPRYRTYLDWVQIQAHDALSDCYMTYAILRYAADRIQDMSQEYKGLESVLPYGSWSKYLSSRPHPDSLSSREGTKDIKWEGTKDIKIDQIKSKNQGSEDSKNEYIYPWAYKQLIQFAKDLRKSQTKAEEYMREILRDRNFLGIKFRRQHPIWWYISDFYSLEHKLIIEIDGSIHNDPNHQIKDRIREDDLIQSWNKIIRFTNDQVLNHIEEVLKRLQSVIIESKYSDWNTMPASFSVSTIDWNRMPASFSVSTIDWNRMPASFSVSTIDWNTMPASFSAGEGVGGWGVSLPTLKSPVASPKTMVDHEFYDWTGLASTSKIWLEHAGFHASLLKLVHPQRKMIIAFAHRAKLDLAKRILADHGITGIGYLRANQYIDPTQLTSLGQQWSRTDEEVSRILKYCSHHHQWLSVLDHNMPWDFVVYQRMRLHRDEADADIILSTHSGVYAALQDNTHTDHAILFWDHQRRLSSAQRFYQSGVRIDHLLSMMQWLIYKIKHTNNNSNLTHLNEIESRWEVLWWVFGSELTKIKSQLPTNNKWNIELIGGLPWDHMHQFGALYERRGEYIDRLTIILDQSDSERLIKTIARVDTLLRDGCQIEIQTSYQWDNLIISPASTYVDYADFRALFAGRHVIFTQTTGQGTDNITTAVLPHPPTIQLSHIRDLNYQSGQKLFIIQSNRNQCRATFDTLMKQWLNKQTLLMGENVTGGGNKLIEQAKWSPAYVMVWGYDLYMQTLASQVQFDAVIVIGSLGVLHDQMVRDVEFFAS